PARRRSSSLRSIDLLRREAGRPMTKRATALIRGRCAHGVFGHPVTHLEMEAERIAALGHAPVAGLGEGRTRAPFVLAHAIAVGDRSAEVGTTRERASVAGLAEEGRGARSVLFHAGAFHELKAKTATAIRITSIASLGHEGQRARFVFADTVAVEEHAG